MDNENKRVDFDLSVLSLKELTKLYSEIKGFNEYLKDNLILDKEEKADGE